MEFYKQQEQYEMDYLSEYASKSAQSKGRELEEKKCDIRTEYQRDRDRILHCKSFRRLKHKTQVFISPEGDHYRTRLTHTLEVSQIARTISRTLRLNEDLTEAIALGHDLGHTPYGHSGEHVLDKLSPCGFKHNEQSIRIVEILEHDGVGLNLTWEVRDGILNHKTSGTPHTLEGKVVQLSDKIAYINHDIDDALRGGVLKKEDLPKEYTDIIGNTSSERINTLISDTIYSSMNENDIVMTPTISEAMVNMRSFLFERVYLGSKAKKEEKKAQHIIEQLYRYFMEHPDMLQGEFSNMHLEGKYPLSQIVCDYIAGMTDIYAKNTFCSIFLPSSWDIY
jgi:dGTPase